MLAVIFLAIILGINAHPFDELHQYVDEHVEDYVQVSYCPGIIRDNHGQLLIIH